MKKKVSLNKTKQSYIGKQIQKYAIYRYILPTANVIAVAVYFYWFTSVNI